MDYKGQKLAEYIYGILTVLIGLLAWVVGFNQGSFKVTVQGWAIGAAISLVVSCCYL